MEPAAGIEPATDGLQNRCSTAELSWHRNYLKPKDVYFVRGEMAGKLIRGILELWGKMVVPLMAKMSFFLISD
jgi:hypothetical protein